jgi:Replication initiator protein A
LPDDSQAKQGQIMQRRKQGSSEVLAVKTQDTIVTPEFVKIEKNLNSLGFFTPSSKTIRSAKAKTITFTRVIDGKKVEAKVTIAPAAIYGLPVTADQDKYLALQKIITDIRQEQGEVKNPICFSSAQILQLLGQADAGKNYKEILEWLKRMTSTTIISEGAVYFAGRRKWAQDTFHVFDRSVAVGQELPDGTLADKNYIWLSEWQLENINGNHLMPIDFEAYKKLKSHVAKALVPMLQVWLFASVEKGSFEKRYDELCQYLNINQCKHLSKIKERLGPALDELKFYGYVSKWKIEPTSDKKSFKVVFYHGDKFHRDRRPRPGNGENGLGTANVQASGPKFTQAQEALVSALASRGVLESAAIDLIVSLPSDQPVQDQLEWIDELVKKGGEKIKNKPGFIVHLIRENIAVPADFITSRRRAQVKANRAEQETAKQWQFEAEAAYQEYCRCEVEKYVQTNMTEDERQEILKGAKQKLSAQFSYTKDWGKKAWEPVLAGALRKVARERMTLIPFEEFVLNFSAARKNPPPIAIS